MRFRSCLLEISVRMKTVISCDNSWRLQLVTEKWFHPYLKSVMSVVLVIKSHHSFMEQIIWLQMTSDCFQIKVCLNGKKISEC